MINQTDIDKVWKEVWVNDGRTDASTMFASRLFLESYPVFKKYIPDSAQTALEVGAGSGRYSLKLAEDFPKMQFTAVDIVEESLGAIERLRQELQLPNLEIRKEDTFHMSFGNDSFDVVFSDAVIQHFEAPDLAVKEMVRVLKPGGRLIISVVNFWNFHSLYKVILKIRGRPYYYGYEKSYSACGLVALLRKNGLKVIAGDGFYPAYGIYRLRHKSKLLNKLDKIVNRAVKILDPLTNRFFSRHFGFERVAVGTK